MTPELKPCPFCGSAPIPVGTQWYRCSDIGCPGRGFLADATLWNRRTPDLTEALARLKALGEAIGRYGRYPGIEPCDEWADEIAAIRNLLERKES